MYVCSMCLCVPVLVCGLYMHVLFVCAFFKVLCAYTRVCVCVCYGLNVFLTVGPGLKSFKCLS